MAVALILLLVAVLAVAGVAGRARLLRNRKRVAALEAFAAARGWSFAPEDDSLVDRWVGAPFGEGDARRATSVVRGSARGRDLVAFDYSYDVVVEDRGTERRETRRFAVVVIDLPAYLPTLEVVPESALRRAAEAVGVGGDITLESEAFDRAFRVSAYDPKFASDVLNPRTMETLVSRPTTSLRLQGTGAISWSEGGLTTLEIVTRADTLAAVVDGIPEFVWRDHAITAPVQRPPRPPLDCPPGVEQPQGMPSPRQESQ